MNAKDDGDQADGSLNKEQQSLEEVVMQRASFLKQEEELIKQITDLEDMIRSHSEETRLEDNSYAAYSQELEAELEGFLSGTAGKRILAQVGIESDIEKMKAGLSALESQLIKNKHFEKKCKKVIGRLEGENRVYKKTRKQKNAKAEELEKDISSLKIEKKQSLAALEKVKKISKRIIKELLSAEQGVRDIKQEIKDTETKINQSQDSRSDNYLALYLLSCREKQRLRQKILVNIQTTDESNKKLLISENANLERVKSEIVSKRKSQNEIIEEITSIVKSMGLNDGTIGIYRERLLSCEKLQRNLQRKINGSFFEEKSDIDSQDKIPALGKG